MVRPDYSQFNRGSKFVVETSVHIEHSAKGSEWKEHKYIKRIDGPYYYPDSYDGGRHLPKGQTASTASTTSPTKKSGRTSTKKSTTKSDKVNLSEKDIENLAREVIRGNFGNGQTRKTLLGENHDKVQKRVNSLLASSSGQKKVSTASSTNANKLTDLAKKADEKKKKRTSVNMQTVRRLKY